MSSIIVATSSGWQAIRKFSGQGVVAQASVKCHYKRPASRLGGAHGKSSGSEISLGLNQERWVEVSISWGYREWESVYYLRV